MKNADMIGVVQRNIKWFLNSGVMRPNDGFWGVAERVAILEGNACVEKLRETFPAQSNVAPGIAVLEHRRPDCCLQTALAFDLAAEVLCDDGLKTVADNLIDFVIHRSCLQDVRADSPTRGLWGWANPNYRDCYWADDNAWVSTLLLILARRGRPELAAYGIDTIRALYGHAKRFMQHVITSGKDVPFEEKPMLGLRLNPHWMGLAAMAFAHAAREDQETDYAGLVADYYCVVLEGPPADDERSQRAASSGLPWSISEYAYLSLAAAVAGAQFGLAEAIEAARYACNVLVERQSSLGHFPSEHYETPTDPNLVDLIYTQNWATLGLLQSAKLFQSPKYRSAFDLSIDLLGDIQDHSPEPHFCGCWRGLYDVKLRTWSGGDRYEGGQRSIYSGWTNAPINLAFLFTLTGTSLLPEEIDLP